MLVNQNPKVAFIIVGWNNLKLLDDCFQSIKRQTYENIEIFYVDNASDDGSVKWVTKNFPKIKILIQNKNTGFAKGNNIGIKEALKNENIKYTALLNTDARIEKDW